MKYVYLIIGVVIGWFVRSYFNEEEWISEEQ